jgi:hypothetical protein
LQDGFSEAAENIESSSITPELALSLAYQIVREHERFHFRFDVYAFYHELILKKSMYNHYFESVYQKVFCTYECFEEALANHAAFRLLFISRGDRLSDIGRVPIQRFLEKLFATAPPGYSDYRNPLGELRSGLGGQMFDGTPTGRLPSPQSNWVAQTKPFWNRPCPEFVLHDSLTKAGKAPQFQKKVGGYIWRVHKSDPDRWPSDPHAHDYNAGVKLDVESGYVYDVRTRKQVAKISKSELVEIRREIERKFPDKPLQPMAA